MNTDIGTEQINRYNEQGFALLYHKSKPAVSP